MTRTLALLSLLAACKHTKGGDIASGHAPARVTILHTNDLHSHLLGWGPNAEYTPDSTGDDGTWGGVARIKTMVDQIRASTDHPVLLLDAGDWMAGTPFQLLGSTEAAELKVAQALGYDAMTIGNHEFDWGPEVLAQIINAADAAGVTVPLLASNIVPNTSDPGDDDLEALIEDGRIQPTLVLTLDNGIEVGLFGLLGDNAAEITPGVAPASFSHDEDAAQAQVAALQAQDVDLIIGVTHNGVTDDPSTSYDEILAQDVPGIDVIIGGHTHTALFDYRTAGADDTVITQAGSYGQYLGQLDLVQQDDGSWGVENYELHLVDDSVQGDATMTAMVDGFKSDLDAGPLAALGHTMDEPIAHVPGDVTVTPCAESGLGDLVTDAYQAELDLVDPEHPIDFAFEAQGVLRDALIAGSSGIEGFSDVFRALPLGYGTDDVPGYGLVSFYVNARELLGVCEVTASIAPIYGCNYFIEVGGMRCNLDMSHSQFNRARSIDRWTGSDWEPIDTSSDQLYHVTVDSYVASLMSILDSLTFGAIQITPKDADGNPLDSPTDGLVDADPDTPGVQEVKLWQALSDYLQRLSDTDDDGIPDLPDKYTSAQGRIVGYE